MRWFASELETDASHRFDEVDLLKLGQETRRGHSYGEKIHSRREMIVFFFCRSDEKSEASHCGEDGAIHCRSAWIEVSPDSDSINVECVVRGCTGGCMRM